MHRATIQPHFPARDGEKPAWYNGAENMDAHNRLAKFLTTLHRAVWQWPILTLIMGLVELLADPAHDIFHATFLLGFPFGLTMVRIVREFQNPDPADLGFSSPKYARYMYPLSVVLSVILALAEARVSHRQSAPMTQIIGFSVLFALIAYLLRPRPTSI